MLISIGKGLKSTGKQKWMNSTTQFGNETTTIMQGHLEHWVQGRAIRGRNTYGLPNWTRLDELTYESESVFWPLTALVSKKVEAEGQDGLDWIMQWTAEGSVAHPTASGPRKTVEKCRQKRRGSMGDGSRQEDIFICCEEKSSFLRWWFIYRQLFTHRGFWLLHLFG